MIALIAASIVFFTAVSDSEAADSWSCGRVPAGRPESGDRLGRLEPDVDMRMRQQLRDLPLYLRRPRL